MNSNSIESQQNAFTHQEHRKIAQIYQKMLLGDKSALSSLQKININSPKQTYSSNNKFKTNQQSVSRQISFYNPSQQNNINKQQFNNVNPFKIPNSFDKINGSNPKSIQKEFSAINLNDDNKQSKNQQNTNQKQKFRNYIKKKVNQLKSQKQILKYNQQKQLSQIKAIKQKLQVGTVNQSKSYDLVKKKINYNKNLTNVEIFPIQQESRKSIYQVSQSAKNTVGSQNTQNKFRKVQSSNQSKVSKNLPPLIQKKRIPTQNSQNSRVNNIERRQISTPINLANSNFQIQLSQNKQKVKSKINKDNQNQITKQKSFSNNQSNVHSIDTKSSKKGDPNKSKARPKISLPQMKKQREQFYLINQQQKAIQADVVQYHKQTVGFIDEIKKRYNLNFKNQNILKKIKQQNQIQPILMKMSESKIMKQSKILSNSTENKQFSKNKSEQKQSAKDIQQQSNKKIKIFNVIQQKIQQTFKDIKLIEDVIQKKRKDVTRIDNKLQENLVIQYWKEHDLQTYDFQDSQDDIPQIDIQNPVGQSRITQSSLNQAYSTAMANAKDKHWKWKVIKQYDTNRSFQEYAKSRSQVKQSKLLQNKLNKIQQNQNDQLQQSGNNKVVVNSRLKNLLLM